MHLLVFFLIVNWQAIHLTLHLVFNVIVLLHASIVDLTCMTSYTDCIHWRNSWMGWSLCMGLWQPSQRPETPYLVQKQQQIRKGMKTSEIYYIDYLRFLFWSMSFWLDPQSLWICGCRNHSGKWRSKLIGLSCWAQSLASTPCYPRAKVVPIGTWKSSSSGQTNNCIPT